MTSCSNTPMAYKNTGIDNSGDSNSGHWNSGYRNSGHWNSGSWNSGDRNSGSWNSGDWNSGHWNSGDWNSGNRNSGYFNTNSPDKIRIFNTWVDMTHEEFNEKHNTYMDIPLNRWIDISDCTDAEKTPACVQMGGYLKTLPFKEACVIWWKENPEEHDRFLNLPAFNADIFYEITGIDVRKPASAEQEAIALLKKNGYKIVKE